MRYIKLLRTIVLESVFLDYFRVKLHHSDDSKMQVIQGNARTFVYTRKSDMQKLGAVS